MPMTNNTSGDELATEQIVDIRGITHLVRL